MEPKQQLETWNTQVAHCDEGAAADMDVAKRLLKHGIEAMEEIGKLRQSLAFYKRRCDVLQELQSKMRDPERTIVCDVLANGCTLPPEHDGGRYKVAPTAGATEVQALSDGINGGGLQPKPKSGGLSEAVKTARGGDAPVRFKGYA